MVSATRRCMAVHKISGWIQVWLFIPPALPTVSLYGRTPYHLTLHIRDASANGRFQVMPHGVRAGYGRSNDIQPHWGGQGWLRVHLLRL
jgi:hypothetical protein